MSQHTAANNQAHPVISAGESLTLFEDLTRALVTHHRPANPAERALVDRMAAARWRQMRIWNALRKALDSGTQAGPRVLREEATHKRQFNSARGELKFLQGHREDLDFAVRSQHSMPTSRTAAGRE